MTSELDLGAMYTGEGHCLFRVWAPYADSVQLHVVSPAERKVELGQEERGYWGALVDGVEPGTLYKYIIGGVGEFPDPASRSQPQGVHGPSEVVDTGFPWTDTGWRGPLLRDYIIYEMHVGTFTPGGTFDSAVSHLDYLVDLGVTAVEMMPVAQFSGTRNWGYDGVYPFAVQDSYGGPLGLKRLVNACHDRGLAVIVDVVYNHVGPEGNYLGKYGPYFTERYSTRWGPALNFDGPDSDEVRHYFVQNALQWVMDFHVDALRLDAVHAILDASPMPFLEELAAAVHKEAGAAGRNVYLMPESADNNSRLVRPQEVGGYGLDAVWSDDFHHALHVALTGERNGYYEDYRGFGDLPAAFRDGFVYTGAYSSSRKRRHGISTDGISAERFVVCCQNHDQVGNRMLGDRLSQLVSFEALKLAAACVILSPFIPLLFMGEEYGETAPFQYFVSHSDPQLVDAVRKGRRDEFASFEWSGDVPDPQDEATFQRVILSRDLRTEERNRTLHSYYKELIRLRRSLPPLAELDRDRMEVRSLEQGSVLLVRRWIDQAQTVAVFNFGKAEVSVQPDLFEDSWRKVLDSAGAEWDGPGACAGSELRIAPESAMLFYKDS